MDAQALIRVVHAEPANRLLGWTLVVCGDLLLTLCIFTFARRLWGSFDTPLQGGALVAIALATVAIPAVFRLAWHQLDRSSPQKLRQLVRLAGPSLAVVLLALAVSLPGSPVWALSVLWLGIAAGEGASWAIGFPRGRWDAINDRTPTVETSEATVSERSPDEEPQMPVGVSQQITRSHDQEGEKVYGLLRCEFELGERLQNLHLAFCPPLSRKPELAAYQVDGPAVTIKAAQVESFGARLELRLQGRALQRESVVVEFVAHVSADNSAGAAPGVGL